MRLVKAVLAYDGSAYKGWQFQKNGVSVQAALEKALGKILGRPPRVNAASRTDGGVHARGQVVHFAAETRLADETLKRAVNFYLPPAVAVRSLESLKKKFHARFDAKEKLYRYTIYTGTVKPVFDRPYVTWIPRALDLGAMRRAARLLVGRHDFTSFSAAASEDKNRVRTIRSITLTKSGDYIFINVRGDGFLTHMVRIIAGTLLQVGGGKWTRHDVRRILESKDRRLAGPTAPAHGLTLEKVYY